MQKKPPKTEYSCLNHTYIGKNEQTECAEFQEKIGFVLFMVWQRIGMLSDADRLFGGYCDVRLDSLRE